MPKVCRPWTTKERQQALSWYAAGVTQAEIAGRLGRTKRAVQAVILKAGRARYCRADFAALAPRIRELNTRGLTDSEIARRLGLAKKTVWVWRSRLGLSANPMPLDVTRRRFRTFLHNHDTDTFTDLRWSKARVARLLGNKEAS